MFGALAEEKRIICLLGLLASLIGLSWSELQISVTLPTSTYVSISGQIVWSNIGLTIFLVGDSLFFASLLLLFSEKRIREVWVAQLGKAVLFTVAYLIFVQRVSGTTTFDSPLFGISIYLENVYTNTAQYIILISVFITLSLVIAGDFLLRRGIVERPSQQFYLATGACNFSLGVVMVASVLLNVSNYSFYPLPDSIYFYTQYVFFSTVDAFEVIGVFSAVLGCIIIAFKENVPQIGKFQLVGGSILIVLAAPLTFIPVQTWMDQYVFYSTLLAPYDLRRIHAVFPLNFNFYTYVSLIVFIIGTLFFLRVSKMKTVVVIGFLVYLYFCPSLRFTFFNYNNFPALTPSIPLYVYAGLVVVLAVIARPVGSQWNMFSFIQGRPRSAVKAAVLLIIAASLLASLIFMSGGVTTTSTPVTWKLVPQKGLSFDDKIDPSLLNLNPLPEIVPVILRFDNPISDENVTSLQSYDFFNITQIYGEEWTPYFAVWGSINTTNIDFQQTLRNLSRDFHLSYILYNSNPSNPPDFGKHHRFYYYVGADILQNWNITGKGTTVAVIDSGINDNDEEIKGKKEGRIIYQVNFLTGQEGDPKIVGDITPDSIDMHGTPDTRVSAGSKGIAPDANIIDLKVKSENGELYYMTYTYTTEAVQWCIRNKDRFNISVIVLAIGCRDQLYGSLTQAVDSAFLNGIVVITCGGVLDVTRSSIIGGLMTPGIADWAITVAATTDYTSNCWSILSPLGPSPHNYPKPELTTAYQFTSASTAVVAGVALLLVQQYNEEGLPPVLRADAIRWALITGAQEHDLGPAGWDIQYGYGQVSALSSYLYLKNYLTL